VQSFARGLEVTVSDPAPGAAPATQRFIDAAWPVLTRLGMLPGADPKAWRFEADPVTAVAGADFVQENAPERIEVKQQLLPAISAVLPADVVIASSTSGLLASRLSEGCRHPGRVVIGHPFNPPHLIPLVEVVGGASATPVAVATAMAFYKAIGKHPIEIRKEVPGHVANRLQAALAREAFHLVEEGVASVADIDAAVREGPGLRWAVMGPNLIFHLAGGAGGFPHFLRHLLPAMQTWWADLGAPQMTPQVQAELVRGVIAEADGRSIAELAAWRDGLVTDILARRAAVEAARRHAILDAELDEALDESFPASDPPAVDRKV